MRTIHVLLLLGALVLLAACAPRGEISSFEECVEAGYSVMESYPRQCSDGDQTFTENLSDEHLVGGDVDEHGCKASAGYAYDEDIGACIRSWELDAADERAATIAVASLPSSGWTVTRVAPGDRCDDCYRVTLEREGERQAIIVQDGEAVVDEGSAEGVVCTTEYAPVCGELQVQCIRAPCPPINTTFGNRCEAEKAGATDIREGACEDAVVNPEGACLSFDGNWVEEANECEGMSEEQCLALGGVFDPCASACRNDPEADFCTMQCVMVCSFS